LKHKIIYTALAALVLAGFLIFMFLAGILHAPVRVEEIERVSSPDIAPHMIVDAVITQSDAGATTSFVYHVFLVPKGHVPEKEDEVFTADKVRDLRVTWREPRFLEIRYERARIFYFRNFWTRKKMLSYVVEIRLVPQNESFSLGYP